MLVRDKKGHLFGGYAADGWAKHGQFYGSALSFIFGLAPAVVRFRASGANQNMLWCGQGFSQLPNGIGWGGKVPPCTCCAVEYLYPVPVPLYLHPCTYTLYLLRCTIFADSNMLYCSEIF